MDRELWRCPRCRGPLRDDYRCVSCALRPKRHGTVIDFLAAEGERVPEPEVNAFYERRPFPGYSDSDDVTAILQRARSSPYLTSLDAAISTDARVLDVGCGTGQIAALLTIRGRRRTVVGTDACLASLSEAARFRERAKLEGLQLVRGDLFSLPLARGAFDVVHCRGVVHHNAEPFAAIREVARYVKPGGVLVLGFYDSLARLPHRVRRGFTRLVGSPVSALDPVLRRPDLDSEKKQAWIDDQYYHPLEFGLAFQSVVACLRAAGFDWLRSVPPADERARFFEPTPEPGPSRLLLRRLGWALTPGSEDAGLVCYIARKQ